MIFQINYDTNDYDNFLEFNEKLHIKNYMIFDDDLIQDFLKKYNYYDKFYNLKIAPTHEYIRNPILCDALRLMILYEFGGIYIDADVFFKENMHNLEDDLYARFGNRTLMLSMKSLFFVKAEAKSPYIKELLNTYLNADELRLDVRMINRYDLKKYINELMIIDHNFLDKYFDHHQITTKEPSKMKL